MIDEDELTLLHDVGAASERVTQQIQQTLASRVNSYYVLLSLVGLAEATLTASVISAGTVNLPLCDIREGVGFLLILGAFVLLGAAVHTAHGVSRKKLAMYLVPEDPELPYLHEGVSNIEVDDFDEDKRSFYFGTPLKNHTGYEDVDAIYRQWVFQKGQTAKKQHQSIEVVRNDISIAQRWLVASVVMLLVAFIVLAIPF